jgi:hypothetical protein
MSDWWQRREIESHNLNWDLGPSTEADVGDFDLIKDVEKAVHSGLKIATGVRGYSPYRSIRWLGRMLPHDYWT